MRRVLLILAVLGLAMGALAAPVMAAGGFRAVIKETFERRASAEPCVFDEVADTISCPGSGTVQGYGRVTSLVVFSFANDEFTITRTLTFRDRSTLVTAEVYTDHRTPGNAVNAPGARRSFGNPAFDSGTWEVIRGTGRFETASGGGNVSNVIAGDVIVITITGDISL